METLKSGYLSSEREPYVILKLIDIVIVMNFSIDTSIAVIQEEGSRQ